MFGEYIVHYTNFILNQSNVLIKFVHIPINRLWLPHAYGCSII